MKIININIFQELDSFLDVILKKFAKQNEYYLLIKNDDFYEIHFEGYIVKIHKDEYLKEDKLYILPINILDNIELRLLFDKLNNKNIIPKLVINELLSIPEPKFVDLESKTKKENPALKKLKKNDYKNSKSSRKAYKKYR